MFKRIMGLFSLMVLLSFSSCGSSNSGKKLSAQEGNVTSGYYDEEELPVTLIKPSQSVCEKAGGYYNTYIEECEVNWEIADSVCRRNGDTLPKIETLREVITDCGGELLSWYEEDYAKNINNESYQACYRKRGFSTNYYWSSTTYVSEYEYDGSNKWYVNFYMGDDDWSPKVSTYYVWCARTDKVVTP